MRYEKKGQRDKFEREHAKLRLAQAAAMGPRGVARFFPGGATGRARSERGVQGASESAGRKGIAKKVKRKSRRKKFGDLVGDKF